MKTVNKYLTEGKSFKFGKLELGILERFEGGKKSNDYVIKKSGGSIRILTDDLDDFKQLASKIFSKKAW